MRKSWFLLFFVLLVSQNMHSQTDYFVPGHVITLEGDTLFGSILYEGNNGKYDVCSFREEGKQNVTKYTPEDLLMFRFTDDKCYVSIIISVKDDAHKTLFVEYLLNGIINIYYSGHDNIYYIQNEEGVIMPMTNEKKEINRDGKNYIVESKQYMGALKYTFMQDEKTMKEVEKIKYIETDLIGIGIRYHNEVCTTDQECIVYRKDYSATRKNEKIYFFNRLKQSFSFGVGTALNIDNYKINENINLPAFYDFNYTNNCFPSIGLFLNFNLFFIRHSKIDFQYEVNLFQNSYSIDYKYLFTHPNFINRNYHCKSYLTNSSFDNQFLIRYSFATKKTYDFFVESGYSMTVNYDRKLGRNLSYSYVWNNELITRANEYREYNNIDKTNLSHGICVGIGSEKAINDLLHLSLTLKYRYNSDMFGFYNLQVFDFIDESHKKHMFSINIGLRFDFFGT